MYSGKHLFSDIVLIVACPVLYILTVSEPQPTCRGDWEHRPPSRAKFCWDDPDWRRDWAHHPRGGSEKGQRTGPRCTFRKLGGGELLSVFSTLLASHSCWLRCWEWALPLSGSAVRILEQQVSQERVLCDWAVRGHGALQQHSVQLTGSTTCSSGAAAVVHFPILYFDGGGHADGEGHHQPPPAQWVLALCARLPGMNFPLKFLNGNFPLCFFSTQLVCHLEGFCHYPRCSWILGDQK